MNESYISGDECPKAQEEIGTGLDWRCIFGQYRIQYLKTPFILFADQMDGY